MKVEMTIKREALALLAPRQYKEPVDTLFTLCDKKHGGYVALTLATPRKPRTTGYKSQNHAINGYIQQIANLTGEDFGVIKHLCKMGAVKRGYPLMERNGQLVYSKLTGEVIPESEANITTAEAGYLIEEIQQLAAEAGIVLEG